MIRQYIVVADNKWDILIFYNTMISNADEIMDTLISLGCPYDSAISSVKTLSTQYNTGMAYSNIENKISFVCISKTTSKEQMFNTAIHELKHVQSHICEYYNVDESSEEAAYLIGYIAARVYRILKMFI